MLSVPSISFCDILYLLWLELRLYKNSCSLTKTADVILYVFGNKIKWKKYLVKMQKGKNYECSFKIDINPFKSHAKFEKQ